jgi:hypothetical protein|mmetsp:Transcript_10439/g.47880  ORF Transcript_10439/g.47880 Transcript_10439/m.47880 type:complete len:627 (+) Transcript_10439:36-1916(+)
MAPTRLTVVLVGQTGNGKSATGNSLLGRDAFVARRSLKSVTERCRVRCATLDADDEPIVPGDPVAIDDDAGAISRPSTVLRVVDTPGTCDSGALLEDNLKHISAFLRGEEKPDDEDDEVDAGGEGLHALVLVLSAATRFTQEEAVALERLVQRLGEGVMRHSMAVFTRANELTADDIGIEEFMQSAPPTLRQLLKRMGHHADGTHPILVENIPTDGSSRSITARAPLLTAVRSLVASVAGEKKCDVNHASYDARALAAASKAADADPSTAALAMLDRLKQQIASGPMAAGTGASDDPQRRAMAEAAMRAFGDLQAQFAARAGLPVSSPAIPDVGAAQGAFGGVFGGSVAGDGTDRVTDREVTRWDDSYGGLPMGPNRTRDGRMEWIVLEGAGDVHPDTACSFNFTFSELGIHHLRFEMTRECGMEPGRFRSSGRFTHHGGGFVNITATVPEGTNPADAPAVTFHSPIFLQGPCYYKPMRNTVSDDDWVEEGVYKCVLAPCSDYCSLIDRNPPPGRRRRLDGPEVVCMLRGVKPGDAVDVSAIVTNNSTRFELQGGSMSLRACSFSTLIDQDSFAVHGVLDVTPRVEMSFTADEPKPEGTTVTVHRGHEWPWKRGEPGKTGKSLKDL